MKFHALLFGVRLIPFHRSSGTHRIATFLRSHDWDIEVCDFTSAWPLESLKEYARSRITSDTKFIGFSVFINYWSEDLNLFIKWLKENYPDVKTVIGGQSVLITAANPLYVDFWVDSYGELAMLELVQYIIGTKQNIQFDMNQRLSGKKVIKALHTYPSWNLGNYQNKLEKRDFLEPQEWLTTELARGCKFKCDFCNFPILGVKNDVSRDADNFKEELIYHYNEFGIKHYYLADETINDRTEKLIKFADVVQDLDFDPFFSGFMRADLLITRKQDWEHLIRMRLGGHYYGIESMNNPSAKVVKKGMNTERLQTGILDWKRYVENKMPYRGTMSFIIGLPYESQDTWYKTKQWLYDNWRDQAVVVFPLDLSDAHDPEKWTNVSDFSKNLMKYGIQEMTAQEITKAHNRYHSARLDESGDRFFWFHKKTYFWKHDTMNYVQAQSLANDFWMNDWIDYKIESWELGNAWIYDNNLTEIEDIYKIRSLNGMKLSATDFIFRYINKKFNWKSS
ncbi:MAG: hypothetical protein EBX50_09580 [Chitinophagia bacterium]|nr:hypothetical protein [Chitinophagia bacterium]